MNTAQITHIFWKEYRTQRSIWLGILLIAVVIQALVWAMMPPNARDPLATLASIGAILSVFYALASAGVLFAGEREEQTYSWLRILPVSNLSLFGGKFLWLAVSWLLAVGVSLLTAYLPYWGTNLNSDKILNGLTQFAVMGGGLALWGIFFSLLCQRVYSALALAPLALLLTAGLNSYFPGVTYALYAAVFIGSVVQGRRWTVEENLAMWTGVGWRSRGLTLDDVLATAAEASPAWRFFRRELWLEWRNARWVALGSFGLLTVTMVFLIASGIPEAPTFNWILVFAILPLAYGVNTFRAEQYESRYRFQSHVGASPAAVWTAKHLVWGGLLALVTAPVLLFMIAVNRFDSLSGVLPVPDNSWQGFLQEQFSASWVPTVVLSLSMACWMYAVGHVCSLLIKRSVSAALVAIALGTLVCVPMAATFLLDVPRVIGMGFPAGSLLLFGLWRTKGWLSERNESRDWVRVFGVLITLGLVCLTSWVMWRMSELTLPPVFAGLVSFFPLAGLMQVSVFGGCVLLLVLLIALVRYRRKLTFRRFFVGWSAIHILSGVAYVTAFDAGVNPPSETEIAALKPSQESQKTGEMYRELRLHISSQIPPVKDIDGNQHNLDEIFSGELEVSDEQWEWLAENKDALDQLLTITERDSCAPRELDWVSRPQDQVLLSLDWDRMVPLLRLQTLKAENEGRLQEAWSFHLAMLRMQRHMLMYRTPTWRDYQLRVINEYYRRDLQRWINRPGQTPQLLEQAAHDFSEVLRDTTRMAAAVESKSFKQMTALKQNQMGSWITWEHADVTIWPSVLEQALHTLPGEKQRAAYMLSKIGEHQLQVAKGIEQGRVSQYAPEIASGYPSRSTQNWSIWNWYEDSLEAKQVTELWRLAETTPLFQAYGIEGFGTAPRQNAWMWVREVTWVQYRRLVFVHLAFRAAKLETGNAVHSLEHLLESRSDPPIDAILNYGEQSEGEKDLYGRSLRDDYPHEFQKYWLYVDPVRYRRFEMDSINMFRNPPTD